MQSLLHLWFFSVGAAIISSVQSGGIDNDSFKVDTLLYGHNRDRHTTPSQKSFVCPATYGRYLHETDCGRYYECRFGVPHLMKCDRNKLYDDKKEKCNDRHKVDCNRKDRDKTTTEHDGDDKEVDHDKTFKCPYIWGTFPHPTLCHKYYVCLYNIPSLFQCQGSKLFDTRSKKCLDQRRVKCGDRLDKDDLKTSKRPTTKIPSTTPQPQKKTTLPEISTTTDDLTTKQPKTTVVPSTTAAPTTTTAAPATTSAPTTTMAPTTTTTKKTTEAPTITAAPTTTTAPTTTAASTTTVAPTTTEAPTTTTAPTTTAEVPITTEAPTTTTSAPITTTSAPITKVTKPNTPPPTECEVDDLDCIIDETGDVTGWFECPERYGHFAHGSSRQLFIHCDNYRPYVKKCADNTVFSPKYLVCMWIGKPGEIIE